MAYAAGKLDDAKIGDSKGMKFAVSLGMALRFQSENESEWLKVL